MRLLVCQPGASYATNDVYTGLLAGLQELGHQTVLFNLDSRIAASNDWFKFMWRRERRRGGPLAETRPTPADVLYHAGIGIVERALRFGVDWVVVVSGMYLHPDTMVLLRRAGCRLALILTESPYDDVQQVRVAPLADVCWTNERSSVPVLREANPRTYYLPAAFDPARLQGQLAGEEQLPEHDVVFVGTGFQDRIELLEAMDWRHIDLGLYGTWTLLPSRSKLRRYVRGSITGPETTLALYRRAKIGLNLYRNSRGFGRKAARITHAESLNPRAYELAAVGAFQLSQYREEVGEMFGPCVPTFQTAQEAQQQLDTYLSDGALRERLAQCSQQCVLAGGHTYLARAAQVSEELEQQLQREVTMRGPLATVS